MRLRDGYTVHEGLHRREVSPSGSDRPQPGGGLTLHTSCGNLTFPPSDRCWKRPRVQLSGLNETRHYDTQLEILMEQSDAGNCDFHQYKSMVIDRRLLKLDQLAGKVTGMTDEIKKASTTFLAENPLNGTGPLAFEELQVSPRPDPREMWESKYLDSLREQGNARKGSEWEHGGSSSSRPTLLLEEVPRVATPPPTSPFNC